MNQLFSQPWVVHLGWTLLHFLWQGTLIAIVFAIARALLPRSMSAQGRYLLACAALGAMTISPVLTYFISTTASRAVWQVIPAIVPPAFVPRDAWQRALPWLVLGWLTGVTAFSARLIGGWRLASRIRSAGARSAPAEWQRTLEGLIARVGASTPVRLLISSLVEVPTVIGWLRPVILMPVGALTGLPPKHVTALLAHELAHIRRHDYLANILQSIAEAVLFYHPAVWWVSDQIRAERELCCDDLAVAACGGDVLTYARALAEVESCRPAHAGAVLAANGGSLSSRIRRLIGQAPSVSQSLPGPGAVLSLALLWLVGIGAVTMHGSQSLTAPPPLSLALSHPAVSAIDPPPLAPPPTPVLSALLFDPFFEPPQPPAPAKAPEQPSTPLSNQHGHRVDLEAAFVADIEMPMTFAEAIQIPSPAALAVQRTSPDPRLRLRVLRAVPGSQVQLISPADAVAFETWVEDTSSDYAESLRGGSSDIERDTGIVTIPRYFYDDLRRLVVKYAITVELVNILPRGPRTYQVTFSDSNAEIPWPYQPPSGAKVLSPTSYPAPQLIEEGDVIALELYRNPQTGQRLVDHIHVGRLNRATLRAEAPHDAYADDAEFNLTKPRLRINGELQEPAALPETLRGPTVWAYVPGYGRYMASFKRQPELGFDRLGEVTGNSLTFAEGANTIRIDCAERIATGSGTYRVHLLRDPDWRPADPKERDKAALGVAAVR
jgi:beta-lactamase regulating signal transducer with metallopeptidase domain